MTDRTVLMQRLTEAIARLPEADSLAYRRALQTAMSVVQRESDPSRFLSACGGDPASAACLLCQYWNERKLIFGDRAFFSLETTGFGALSLEDIHVVRSACAACLPLHNSGCSVLVVDHSRSCQASPGSRARALFYHLHHVSVNPLSQTEGFYVLVRQLVSMEHSELMTTEIILLFCRIVQIHPVRVKSLQLVVIVSLSFNSENVIRLVELNILAVKQRWEQALNLVAKLHTVTTENKAGHLLEAEGFTLACLPISMGGAWSYEYDFGQWWVSRIAAEQFLRIAGTNRTAHMAPIAAPAASASTQALPFPVRNLPPSLSISKDDGLSVLDDPSIRQRGCHGLDDAIQLQPAATRAAYVEALKKCPDLVKSESDPIWFLRYERYDPWAAARRLTTYWMWRKRIFGDRAFLPIDMTGEGALTLEDIVHVRRGYFSIAPNDQFGSSIIVYDPSRRVHHSKKTRMRVGFYFWSVMCENEITRRDGWVGIMLVGTSGFGSSSLDDAVRECADMVQESFPTHIKQAHLVQVLKPGGRRTILQMALPVINYVMGRIMEGRAATHVTDTAEEMLARLAKYGIDAQRLPETAGGVWTYDDFYLWQLERCKTERERNRSRATLRAHTAEPVRVTSLPSGVISGTADTNQLIEMVRRLPNQEKSFAVEAINRRPKLVDSESSPRRFLQLHNFLLAPAAEQFCLYWKVRCSFFGEKAFLPLTQTGEGALVRSDLTLLSSGFFKVLPTRKDEPVCIFYDASNQGKTAVDATLRIGFYIFQVASENHLSQSEGVTIIVSGLGNVTKEKHVTEFQLIFDALPVKVKAIHFTHIYGSEAPKSSLDSAVAVLRRRFGTAGNENGLLHLGRSKDDIHEQLAPYGIPQELLPKSLGGNFGYDRFIQWCELRTRFEWGLPAGANDHDATESYDFSGVVPLSELNPEDRKERKRRMNVVHSRRKRERERIEISVLQEQCAELKEANIVLLRDKHHLENLIRDAGRVLQVPGLVAIDAEQWHDRKPAAVVRSPGENKDQG